MLGKWVNGWVRKEVGEWVGGFKMNGCIDGWVGIWMKKRIGEWRNELGGWMDERRKGWRNRRCVGR